MSKSKVVHKTAPERVVFTTTACRRTVARYCPPLISTYRWKNVICKKCLEHRRRRK